MILKTNPFPVSGRCAFEATLCRFFLFFAALFMAAGFLPAGAFAQSGDTGSVAGRVFNTRTGQYVERARIQVTGTSIEAFSDSTGHYALTAPSGSQELRVFFTGLDSVTVSVEVSAGGTLNRNIQLGGSAQDGDEGEVLTLAPFEVKAEADYNAAAIAINLQRFSESITSVLSTEEFGYQSEGNVADFLKFMSGIAVDDTGGNARDITLNGVDSQFVPITVEGFDVASAGVGLNTSRSTAMDFTSINNLSRIEVTHSPLPEHSGGAFAGSINLVPRSSFERNKSELSYRVFLQGRSNEFELGKTPGPDRGESRKTRPGFELSWVDPVSDKFGYTVNLGYSDTFSPESRVGWRWHGGGAGTGNPARFPITTPDMPYATRYNISNASKETARTSFGTTLDFRVSEYDRISVGFQFSDFELVATNTNLSFDMDRVADFETDENSSSVISQFRPNNQIDLRSLVTHRNNETKHPTVVWYHNGPEWMMKAGVGKSSAKNENRSEPQGALNVTHARMRGGAPTLGENFRIAFNDIMTGTAPSSIEVSNAAGDIINPFVINDNYYLIDATILDETTRTSRLTGYFDAERSFGERFPIEVKAGMRFEEFNKETINGFTRIWFAGADGVSGGELNNDNVSRSRPDNFLSMTESVYSNRGGEYGLPAIAGIDNYALYDHYQANPNQWTVNELGRDFNRINDSRDATETVTAAYVQASFKTLNNKLHFVGGLRAEQTEIDSFGPLTDLTLPREDAVSQLVERGYNVQTDYINSLTRFGVNYNITDRLIFRLGYFESFGRPNLIQYSGSVTIPDNTDEVFDPEDPDTGRDIFVVGNPDIDPWSAESVTARLEYYFADVGKLTISAFTRDHSKFFESVEEPVTQEFLNTLGLNLADYPEAVVRTQVNGDRVITHNGFSVSYNQALKFLPEWARGVRVFANYTHIDRDPSELFRSPREEGARDFGSQTDNVLYPYETTANWGVNLSRERFTLRFNWNYRAEKVRERIAWDPNGSLSTSEFAFRRIPERLTLTVDAEYNLSEKLSLFANVRNLTEEPELIEIYGPETPSYARVGTLVDYGANITFGVKGKF